MQKRIKYLFLFFIIFSVVIFYNDNKAGGLEFKSNSWLSNSFFPAPPPPSDEKDKKQDSTKTAKDQKQDSTKVAKDTVEDYKPSTRPVHELQPDPYSDYGQKQESPLFLGKPSSVETKIKVDSSLDYYTIEEKIGDMDYRPPTNMTYEEYEKMQEKQILNNYWKKKSKEQDKKKQKDESLIPKIHLSPTLNRIFGGSYVDIKPNGSVMLDFGGQWQTTRNPAIPISQQTTGGFEFDQQINLNVKAKIGEKLQFNANQNTNSQFDFENTLKLDYSTEETDIIQQVEAGNVSMPINSSLIQGAQNLFGVKTKLKFGRLKVTSIVANQRGSKEEIDIEGGSQTKRFEIRADEYEANQHFFLGHFFRDKYNSALSTLPYISGGVNITRVEVYVTNRNNTTRSLRDVVALANLGEHNVNKLNREAKATQIDSATSDNIPDFYQYNQKKPADNDAENFPDNPTKAESKNILGNEEVRNNPISELESRGLQNGTDFELVRGARKLKTSEYRFHPKLGYISLNAPLNQDDMLAVAFEYTYNGEVYQVGELTEDYQDVDDNQPIFLKLLKHVKSNSRSNHHVFDLQMKNIYSLNAAQVNRDGFQLRVIYKNDVTQVDNPSLNEGKNVDGVPLIELMNLDQLNMSNDPQPDGNFDFVESSNSNTSNIGNNASLNNSLNNNSQGNNRSGRGRGRGRGRQSGSGNRNNQNNINKSMNNTISAVTIDPAYGRVIFPVVEPFGHHLVDNQNGFIKNAEDELIDKYVFSELYNEAKSELYQYARKNKYFIKGRLKSEASNKINLPGMNIPKNSVTVRSGGDILQEGQDYRVDYNLNTIKILNPRYLMPGRDLNVQFEKSDMFSVRSKGFMGTRLDYTVSEDIQFGGTFLHLNERPLMRRVSIGNVPTNNTMWGVDGKYHSKSRILTRAVDKIPLIDTKAESTVDLNAEFAQIIPGTPKLISKEGGRTYIDDFEGSEVPFQLGNPAMTSWSLAATPKGFEGQNFPQDSLALGYRRAKIAWYNVDQVFYQNDPSSPDISQQAMQNHYARPVRPQEIFPERDPNQIQLNENLFNIAYFPDERGPYNYNPDLTSEGNLKENSATENWGGISRRVGFDTDFDNANYQFIEFWVMDPFADEVMDGRYNQRNRTGGELIFHLGSVSEDVLRDGRHAFEHGLPTETGRPHEEVTKTQWGYVSDQQYMPTGFLNEEGARSAQDIGIDGLNNNQERDFFQEYLNKVTPKLNNEARQRIQSDPSGDNFEYYLGNQHDSKNHKLVERYKEFGGLEGNSPVSRGGGGRFNPSSTTRPNDEDINKNNTLDAVEEYYKYKIKLTPSNLNLNNENIVSKQRGEGVDWYQFRIPIRKPDGKEGNIQDFKSIRFMRMLLTKFKRPVVLRMANFQLIANQWRKYQTKIGGALTPHVGTVKEIGNFKVSTVNIEENSQGVTGKTSPYKLPPGFTRDRDNTSTVNRRVNEQSLSLKAEGLSDGKAKAVFKNVDANLLNYKRLKMEVHAEDATGITENDEMTAFVRIGTDYNQNYYEIEIPLKLTDLSNSNPSREQIWKNTIDIAFNKLSDLKVDRNRSGWNVNDRYPEYEKPEKQKIYVKGNPDYSAVKNIMIGIRNPRSPDQQRKNIKIWANELRLTGFNKSPGSAARASLNMQLADFATISANGKFSSPGFGGLEQQVSDRRLETNMQYGVNTNFSLHKFFPKNWGLNLPLSLSYNREDIQPKFDPLNPDVKTNKVLESIEDRGERRRYRRLIQENTIRRSISMSNISKQKTGDSKSHLWDVENLSLSVGYNDLRRTNKNTQMYFQKNYQGGAGYNYTFNSKPIEPLKNVNALSSPYFKLIKDFNFNPLPGNISVRGDLKRQFTKRQLSNGIEDGEHDTAGIRPTFQKRFTFNRTYGLGWNFTKNLNFNYSARTNALVDEPRGEINEKEIRPGFTKKDSVVKNLMKGGRIKNFNQDFGLNYKLPFDKFPLTDWIKADAQYNTSFNWTAGALGIADSLGNTAQNTSKKAINGKIDLKKLYNKATFLKKLNSPNRKRKKEKKPESDSASSDSTGPGKFMVGLKKTFNTFARFLMSAKSINFNYNLNEGTTLPGYMGGISHFGLDKSMHTDFLPFVLGSQNRNIYQNPSFANTRMSKSNTINEFVTQNMSESFDASTSLQPLKGLRIQLNANKTNSASYQELFKYNDSTNQFQSLNPSKNGSYQISYVTAKTAFIQDREDNSSPVFEKFESNRSVIQDRLMENNPHSIENGGDSLAYSRNGQDVLIPAFLAAYSGTPAKDIKLSNFPTIPLPNWRIDYSGLSKIPFMKKFFRSFSINHSYSSSFNVNSYTTSLKYGEKFLGLRTLNPDRFPDQTDDSGRVAPINVINNISISEQFSPLLGINMRTNNNINLRFSYRKSRNLQLNMANTQVTEQKSTSYTIGAGYTTSELKLPFKYKGRDIVLENDVTFRLDITLRDTKTAQRVLDGNTTITSGMLNWQIRPNVSYKVNKRLNAQLYFNYSLNDPKVSTSFRRTSTRFGIQLRYSLSG